MAVLQRIASGTTLLNPAELIRQAEVSYGQVVAELGCGAGGYFVLQAGKVVGEKGHVWGVDIQKSALVGMMSQAKLAGLGNVTPVWSNLEVVGAAKKIKSGSVDVALAINLFHQSKQHETVLREANRMLKVGGKLLVVDWKPRGSPFGPSQNIRVAADVAAAAAAPTGFRELKRFDAGPHHWAILFEKRAAAATPTWAPRR